ncbi:MAG: hypothetical protein PHY16_05305 [Methylobacter sp.]|nr:hypothetical protein [Methylobacter sp.]
MDEFVDSLLFVVRVRSKNPFYEEINSSYNYNSADHASWFF